MLHINLLSHEGGPQWKKVLVKGEPSPEAKAINNAMSKVELKVPRTSEEAPFISEEKNSSPETGRIGVKIEKGKLVPEENADYFYIQGNGLFVKPSILNRKPDMALDIVLEMAFQFITEKPRQGEGEGLYEILKPAKIDWGTKMVIERGLIARVANYADNERTPFHGDNPVRTELKNSVVGQSEKSESVSPEIKPEGTGQEVLQDVTGTGLQETKQAGDYFTGDLPELDIPTFLKKQIENIPESQPVTPGEEENLPFSSMREWEKEKSELEQSKAGVSTTSEPKKEETSVEKMAPEEKIELDQITEKRNTYLKLYKEWNNLPRKDKKTNEGEKLKEAMNVAKTEYEFGQVNAARKLYREEISKGSEEKYVRAEISQRFVDEEVMLKKLESESSKDRGILGKAFERYSKLKPPIKWIIAAGIGTGVMVSASAIAGFFGASWAITAGVGTVFKIRLIRSVIGGSLIPMVSKGFDKLGVKKWVESIERGKEEKIAKLYEITSNQEKNEEDLDEESSLEFENEKSGPSSEIPDFIEEMYELHDKIEKITSTAKWKQRWLNIGKLLASVAIGGGASFLGSGMLENALGMDSSGVSFHSIEKEVPAAGEGSGAVSENVGGAKPGTEIDGEAVVRPKIIDQDQPTQSEPVSVGTEKEPDISTTDKTDQQIGLKSQNPESPVNDQAPKAQIKPEETTGKEVAPESDPSAERSRIEELATIGKGQNSPWKAIARQIRDQIEHGDFKKYGLSPEELSNKAKVDAIIDKFTTKELISQKYMSPDGTVQVRTHPGAKVYLNEYKVKLGIEDVKSKTYEWKQKIETPPEPVRNVSGGMESDEPIPEQGLHGNVEKFMESLKENPSIPKAIIHPNAPDYVIGKPPLPSEEWIYDHEKIFKKAIGTLSRQSEHSFKTSSLAAQERVLSGYEVFSDDISRFREYLKHMKQNGWNPTPDRIKIVDVLERKIEALKAAHWHATEIYEKMIKKTGLVRYQYDAMAPTIKVSDVVKMYESKGIDPKFVKIAHLIKENIKNVDKHLPSGIKAQQMTIDEFFKKVAQLKQ
ncbi:MAG: hypothetical protein Q7R98_02675 [Candidatus Jorgensenbacteria bacterium]|nr:hypothetical protein [Candidatus Jorgensenbacteria bacterium]